MTTPMQSAIDEVKVALGLATFAIAVQIGDTPSKRHQLESLGDVCILHVEGGGLEFVVEDRSAALSGNPEVSISVMKRIGSDAETGDVDRDRFDECEAVLMKTIEVARDAIKASARFGLLGVDIPERYDFERLTQKGRIYLSTAIFTLWDTTSF